VRSGEKTGRIRAAVFAALAATLAGCGQLITTGSDLGVISRGSNEYGSSYNIPARPLLPNASLQLTPSYAITLEKLLYGAAIYYFVDPLSPNWQGELKRLSEDTFSISMRAKRFRSTGGDGESGRVFRRNAEDIMRAGGFDGYTILSYSEGIESETLGAVRVSEGVIRVTRK
jgi:hypothetical protein